MYARSRCERRSRSCSRSSSHWPVVQLTIRTLRPSPLRRPRPSSHRPSIQTLATGTARHGRSSAIHPTSSCVRAPTLAAAGAGSPIPAGMIARTRHGSAPADPRSPTAAIALRASASTRERAGAGPSPANPGSGTTCAGTRACPAIRPPRSVSRPSDWTPASGPGATLRWLAGVIPSKQRRTPRTPRCTPPPSPGASVGAVTAVASGAALATPVATRVATRSSLICAGMRSPRGVIALAASASIPPPGSAAPSPAQRIASTTPRRIAAHCVILHATDCR